MLESSRAPGIASLGPSALLVLPFTFRGKHKGRKFICTRCAGRQAASPFAFSVTVLRQRCRQHQGAVAKVFGAPPPLGPRAGVVRLSASERRSPEDVALLVFFFPSCSESVHNSPETMPGSWPLSFPTFPGCQRALQWRKESVTRCLRKPACLPLETPSLSLPILGLFHFILSVRPFMEVVEKSASIASPQRPELRPRRLGRLLQESFSPELRAPKAGQVSESALSPPTQALSLPSRPLGAILATLKRRGAEVPGDAFLGTRPLLVASSAKILLCGANRRPHMNRAELRALRRPS